MPGHGPVWHARQASRASFVHTWDLGCAKNHPFPPPPPLASHSMEDNFSSEISP